MASAADTPVELKMTAGLPYNRSVRVTGAAAVWPTVDDFEVRSQIREGKTVDTPLLYEFAQHITKAVDGQDIVLTIDLTGAQTRLIKAGFYDIIVSDPGTEDARGLPVLAGKVKIGQLVTAAANE